MANTVPERIRPDQFGGTALPLASYLLGPNKSSRSTQMTRTRTCRHPTHHRVKVSLTSLLEQQAFANLKFARWEVYRG